MSKVEATMRASVGDRLFEFAVQFGFIVGAALLYFGVRGLTEGSEAIAVANGLDLLAFERAIGVAVEAE
ncbi:MAG: hypothetical protein OEW83_18685, partial [Acidimicrobiia bacterium]|nr:hypothetical protein [Acidimicrobiia bacterium]